MPSRFPPPWSVEEPDPKLQQQCFIVRDGKGQALAYVQYSLGADFARMSQSVACASSA